MYVVVMLGGERGQNAQSGFDFDIAPRVLIIIVLPCYLAFGLDTNLMSHAASDLTTAPLINGSIVFAVLVSIGLLSVLFARARKLIESKDVVMVCIFVLTAGFSMWIVWLSVWMVRDQ